MSRRRVINLPGTTHKAPIPQAVVVDNVLYSSAVNGKGADGAYPETAAAQAKLAFANMAEIVRLAGGSTDDIVRVTVFLRDRADKAVIDDEWLAMFPDPADRPARHAVGMERGGAALLQLEFVAVLRADRAGREDAPAREDRG